MGDELKAWMFGVNPEVVSGLDELAKGLGLRRTQAAHTALALGMRLMSKLTDSEALKDLLGMSDSSASQKTSVASEAKPSHLSDDRARSSQRPSKEKSSSPSSRPAKASAKPAPALAPSRSESPANGQPEAEEEGVRDNPFEALT